ncbi:MAG: serine/threonine-protein kinase [Isosphaeraceae bacterium]
MTPATPRDDDSLDAAELAEVVDRLEGFERAWAAGTPPRIEDLLGEVADHIRPRLLRELLLTELEQRRRRGEIPTSAPYRARFPELADVVDAAFAASPVPPPDPAREAARNLLFGLLAFQNGFIDREALLGAFGAWVADKERPIGRFLLERGALNADRYALLESLVAEHLKLHGGDPERSLADLSSVGSGVRDLGRLTDDDLQASVATVGKGREEETRTYPSEESPRRAGQRFRILKLHAEGGLGRVYEAEDLELGRKVAIKEIQPEQADRRDLRSRFVLEAEISGGLQHPGIVPVYSLGYYDDGKPFYAMRFVEGASLREKVADHHKAHPRPDPTTKEFRDLLNRFLDVCNAIAFAHSKGVLHRDLKPHNVMIGDYGEALIIDWGLAKATGRRDVASGDGRQEPTLVPPSGSALEQTRGLIGTLNYMSPEQARADNAALGPVTDVYGLGAILYHLLTGQAPIPGRDPDEVLPRVIAGQVAPPRSINSHVPLTLEAVCLKALAREPADRYPTARALADDLAHWMADEPTTVRSDPLLVRIGRWTRRHRVATAAAAASLLVGLAASLYGYQRQRIYATNLEQANQDAIAAVRRFGDVVAKNGELKNRPDLESLRKELLKEPLSFFRSLRDRLQADNDTRPEAFHRLAGACHELGHLTHEIGDVEDALRVFQESLAIRQRLADANPAVTEFQAALAASHGDIALLLHQTGKPAEALRSYERALAIWQRLSDANPAVTEFQRGLAGSHNNIALLLSETGKPAAEALRSHERALAILHKLVASHPESPDFISPLGGTLNNIARLDLEARRFSEARDRLREAIAWQRKALGANPRHPTSRQFLRSHYINLLEAAQGLHDATLADEARRGLAELHESDPEKKAHDARLDAVLSGDAPQDNPERLALVQWAYEAQRHALAVRLCAEALAADPSLAADRQTQLAYSAACAAALAAAGEGKDDPAPDGAARAALRHKALNWLKSELNAWEPFLTASKERAFVLQVLRHWQQDPDLASVRDPDALSRLTEAERAAWQSLWAEVDRLIERADRPKPELPGLPGEVFSRP